MKETKISPSREWLRTSAFLCALLAVIVVYPFLTESLSSKLIASFLILATLAGGVASMFSHRHALMVTVAVVAFSVAIEILPYLFPGVIFKNITYLRSCLVNLFFALLLFYYLLRVEHLSLIEIGNSVSIYLLVGLSFAYLYCFIAKIYPGAFSYPMSEKFVPQTDLVYYSFVTLTTTGYGDIHASMKITRVLSNIESIFGVFYIAVIIGKMVGTGKKV